MMSAMQATPPPPDPATPHTRLGKQMMGYGGAGGPLTTRTRGVSWFGGTYEGREEGVKEREVASSLLNITVLQTINETNLLIRTLLYIQVLFRFHF